MRHRWLSYGGAGLLVVAVFAGAVVWSARATLFSGAASGGQCSAATAMARAVEETRRDAVAAIQTGDPRDITALPYNGTDTLADFKGQTILLNLWATWCAPCRAEMPSLAALHTDMASEDFQVVGVSIDHRDGANPENFLKDTNATALEYHREPTLTLFNSLRDEGLAIGMPTTLLIAPDGCVAGVLHGPAEWDAPSAKLLIREALRTVGTS